MLYVLLEAGAHRKLQRYRLGRRLGLYLRGDYQRRRSDIWMNLRY